MGFIKLMLLLLALIIFPLELMAETADWSELTKNASATAIYSIDAAGIHYDGDRVTFWDPAICKSGLLFSLGIKNFEKGATGRVSY